MNINWSAATLAFTPFDPWHMLILLGSVAAYPIPAVIAFVRHHPHRVAILLVNLLLGWTMLGWIAALVWAVMRPEPRRENQA